MPEPDYLLPLSLQLSTDITPELDCAEAGQYLEAPLQVGVQHIANSALLRILFLGIVGKIVF